MVIQILPYEFTICKVKSTADIDLDRDFVFAGKTDEEISLVCKSGDVPAQTAERSDGWRAMRIQGKLDFSLTGILSGISSVLADNGIGIFAVSTFNTDYILVRSEDLGGASQALAGKGYTVV